MKIRKLVGGLILSTVLAAGIGVFVSSQKAETKNVEAADTITIYCTQGASRFQGGISVYKFGDEWGNFTAMDPVFVNSSSQQVYKVSIPDNVTGIVFVTKDNNNSQIQSVDIKTGITNNAAWYTIDEWQDGKFKVGTWPIHPYTINYYGNGSTSGSMPSETGYADVAWGLTSNAYSKTGYSFDGWNTEADGSGTSYDNGALIPKDSSFTDDTLNLYAKWKKVYPAGRYIVGTFCDWSIDGAIAMTYGSEYVATNVSLSIGDEFKLADYNGSSFTTYYGYSSSIGGGLFCFSQNTSASVDYNNFVCWASGSYNFYSTSSEYETGKNISVEISGTKYNAEQLAAKLMSYDEWEGHCNDEGRFPFCKGKFIDMDSSEQTKFQGFASSSTAQFKNAYNRYTAWARATGENPWVAGKAMSITVLLGGSSESAATTIIIVSITSVCLVAVGGYFLFRRKKEN